MGPRTGSKIVGNTPCKVPVAHLCFKCGDLQISALTSATYIKGIAILHI